MAKTDVRQKMRDLSRSLLEEQYQVASRKCSDLECPTSSISRRESLGRTTAFCVDTPNMRVARAGACEGADLNDLACRCHEESSDRSSVMSARRRHLSRTYWAMSSVMTSYVLSAATVACSGETSAPWSSGLSERQVACNCTSHTHGGRNTIRIEFLQHLKLN